MSGFIDIAVQVGRACEAAGVDYVLTGSVAATLHGISRTTQDIDLVLELSARRVERLVEALGPDFEVDRESLKEAADAQRSWNIFHVPTMTKVDLFVLSGDTFAQAAFARRIRVELAPGRELSVFSPEALVVQKLRWFRQGGEVALQQWRDVIGILNANPHLDAAWMSRWASSLELTDLLERARHETPRSL